MRKIQCHKDDESIWSYFVPGENNPCGCGSNCYHLEYDGANVFGVCNACESDIYEVKPEYTEQYLKDGIWKFNRREGSMTLEEKRIAHLYDLLQRLEDDDPDVVAALRWAIFTLEQRTENISQSR